MSTLVRIFGAIAIICTAVLGLGFVSGYISEEFFRQNSLQLLLGLGVLFAAAVGLKLLSAGRGDSRDTEPPPTL